MRILGSGGATFFGYQRATVLGQWSVTASGYQPQASYTLEAAVLDRDDYWASASEYHSVSLRMGERQWVWHNVKLTGETTITGELMGSPLIT